ncbi:leucine rich repeat protein, partial [Toxoplasma gondii TgCatPRC2]
MYTQGGSPMYGADGLWLNLFRGFLNVAWIIAAFLRCLYACVQGATSSAVVNETVAVLRRVSFLRKLISLVEACPVMTCHIAAKFFRLMNRVLRMQPHQSAESMDLVVNYALIADFSVYVTHPLLFVLKHSASRPLNHEEQILCGEVASFYAMLARQTSYVKYSSDYQVQKWATEIALEKFFTTATLRTLVGMLLFDIQIDAGTA